MKKLLLFLCMFGIFSNVLAVDPAPYGKVSIAKNIDNIDELYSIGRYRGETVIDTVFVEKGKYEYRVHLGIVKFKLKNSSNIYPDSIKLTGFGSHIKIKKKGDVFKFQDSKHANILDKLPLLILILILLILKTIFYYKYIDIKYKKSFLINQIIYNVLILSAISYFLNAIDLIFAIFLIFILLVAFVFEIIYMSIIYKKRGALLVFISYTFLTICLFIYTFVFIGV